MNPESTTVESSRRFCAVAYCKLGVEEENIGEWKRTGQTSFTLDDKRPLQRVENALGDHDPFLIAFSAASVASIEVSRPSR